MRCGILKFSEFTRYGRWDIHQMLPNPAVKPMDIPALQFKARRLKAELDQIWAKIRELEER